MLPPNFGTQATSYTNLTFQLDGQLVGTFQRTADVATWTYNYSVYSTSDLESKEHTFVIQPQAGVDSSYVAVDYFVYE